MKKINERKGISLIVLVITIIVMIILATAIILSLDDSNIEGKAEEARKASDLANAKNVVVLAQGDWMLMSDSEKEELGSFSDYAESKLQEAGYDVTGDGSLAVSEKGMLNTRYVDSNGKEVIIPEGFVASQADGEADVETGLVIYAGTEDVTDENVENAHRTRNQFVWVPVDNIANFVRVDGYTSGKQQNFVSTKNATEPYSYTTSITEANDLTGEYAEYKAMYNSVKEFGGFFIGRYETGTSAARTSGSSMSTANGTTKVLIQKNKPIYNAVAWGPSMTSVNGDITYSSKNQGKGAVELSRGLYNMASAKTHLVYGVEWDAALNFIATHGVKDTTYASDGTNKGCYGTTEHTTGFYSLNNIFDLGGNYYEWTMEAYQGNKRIARGGNAPNTGLRYPASFRMGSDPAVPTFYIGFRVAMYLV